MTRRVGWFTNFDINAGVGMVTDGFSVLDNDIVFRRPSDMTDGISQTAAFSERLVWPDWAPIAVASGTRKDVWPRRILRIAQVRLDVDEFADECEFRALPPSATWAIYRGYTHNLSPNRNSCVNGPGNSVLSIAVTARSLHPGSVNMALADGSARSVSDSIDRSVWRKIGTRNGHESVGEW